MHRIGSANHLTCFHNSMPASGAAVNRDDTYRETVDSNCRDLRGDVLEHRILGVKCGKQVLNLRWAFTRQHGQGRLGATHLPLLHDQRVTVPGCSSEHPRDLSGNLHWTDLVSADAALFGQTRQSLSGRVAHRHLGVPHPTRIGWPARPQTLPWFKAGLNVGDDSGQPCGAAPPPVWGTRATTFVPRPAASFSMFLAMFTSPLPAFRLPGLDFFQQEADFQVLVVDHQPDNSLPCLAPRLVDPDSLVNGLVVAILARDEQHQQRHRGALRAPRAPVKTGMKTSSVFSSARI